MEEANYFAQVLNLVICNDHSFWVVVNGIYLSQAAQLAAATEKTSKSLDAKAPLDVTTKLLEDFYMTDSISRASPTMAKCVTAVKAERTKKYFKS